MARLLYHGFRADALQCGTMVCVIGSHPKCICNAGKKGDDQKKGGDQKKQEQPPKKQEQPQQPPKKEEQPPKKQEQPPKKQEQPPKKGENPVHLHRILDQYRASLC